MKTRIIGAIVAFLLAVVGAVVVVLYVKGADDRAFEDSKLTEVYVVEVAIPAGTPAEAIADFVTVERYPARTIQEGRVLDLADLDGLVTATELLPGDQVIEDRFIDPQLLALQGDVPVPEGMQEVTVSLPIAQVAGGVVTPGSHVGILVSGNTENPVTQFILQKVLVTRVSAGDAYQPGTVAEGEEVAPVTTMLITLALTTPEVEKVVWAAELDALWLTLQPDSVDIGGSRPVTRDNIFQ
jgi:pilus assembly protein CpaB